MGVSKYPSASRTTFAHLVVALLEGLLRKTLPAVRPVDGPGGLQSHIKITAFNREIEARVLVLDEVQRDLLEQVTQLLYYFSILHVK